MIFRTSIQTVILPPSYAASSSSHMDRQSSTEDANSQAAQYEKSLALISSSTLQKGKGKERNRDLVLPPGGGPFKGFGFVVVASKADARRILKESEWNRPPPVTVTIKPVVSISVVEQPIPESQATDEDDIEKMMDLEDEKLIRAQVDSILAEEFEEPAVEVELDLNVDLTVLEKQLEMERNDLTQLGRDSGLRATTLYVLSLSVEEAWADYDFTAHIGESNRSNILRIAFPSFPNDRSRIPVLALHHRISIVVANRLRIIPLPNPEFPQQNDSSNLTPTLPLPPN